jgi:hypothetical protein
VDDGHVGEQHAGVLVERGARVVGAEAGGDVGQHGEVHVADGTRVALQRQHGRGGAAEGVVGGNDEGVRPRGEQYAGEEVAGVVEYIYRHAMDRDVRDDVDDTAIAQRRPGGGRGAGQDDDAAAPPRSLSRRGDDDGRLRHGDDRYGLHAR